MVLIITLLGAGLAITGLYNLMETLHREKLQWGYLLVAGVGYGVCFMIFMVLSTFHTQQNTIDNLGSGKAHIETIYTIQNQDTIQTEYELIYNK